MTDENTPVVSQQLPRWRPLAITLAIAVAVALGVADYTTGSEIMISAFYLGPICWATWNAGRNAGLFLAVVCAAIWLAAELAVPGDLRHLAIPIWNAFMLLTLYAVVVFLLSKVCRDRQSLEEAVQRRTAALQAEIDERERWEMAKIQAERLAVIGSMASVMAHEVRNPLGSIVLNLDLFQKEIGKLAATSRHPPDEAHLLVNEMRVEVHRIKHVLDDYLQFSRMPKLQRRPLGLNDFLDEKLAFMKSEFEQTGVKLRTAFDPSVTMVEAEGEQLWQALLNLLRNGIEAMHSGGELAVSTRRDETHIMVQVSDEGRGITAEHRKRVFTPFFTTKPTGTGLGLTLVQQIVSEHRGHVECESAPGEGSTFTIFLPLMQAS
jgi:signal transduction histidine kinase